MMRRLNYAAQQPHASDNRARIVRWPTNDAFRLPGFAPTEALAHGGQQVKRALNRIKAWWNGSRQL
jgi:hypothetical protein